MTYHNITTDDMLNGDGLRTVLWVSGCSHGCKECHNPVTWDPDGGLLFDQAARNELFDKLGKNYISGVTFSGGDPLYPDNRQTITELACESKQIFPQKTIWLYTGFTWEQICQLPIIRYLDVLVDGTYDCSKRDVRLYWRGSSNQRVIDVPRTLETGQVVLHI